MDRIQTVSHGNEVFKERCCRMSFGVQCREEYNPNNIRHVGQKLTRDNRDGKTWVEDQVDWFVRQVSRTSNIRVYNAITETMLEGENVPSTGITKPYLLKIKPGSEQNPWKTNIVISAEPRDRLPTSLDQDRAKVLCSVESVLKDKGVDMKLKNRHWYSRGEKYIRARFEVKIILGAADLKFQLESRDRKVLSNGHDAIQIRWDPPQRSPRADEDTMALY